MIDDPKTFVLPPLPARQTYHWLEAQLLLWQKSLTQRQSDSRLLVRWGYAILNRLVARLLRSGRKFPMFYRLWSFIGRLILGFLPKKPTAAGFLLDRMFQRNRDTAYHGSYVAFNFLFAALMFWLILLISQPVGESAYILLSYRHNKYTDVIVTSHYPDRLAPHVFAVHGYQIMADGKQEELFAEIGPSYWFQEYNSEIIFGKIRDNATCDFDAYGYFVRIPLALRYLSKDSLYALNPWIVDVRCK